MSADDRDYPLEELLRTSLHSEAETIVPAGDGLGRIQRRVATRRRSVVWWRPIVALGSAAVVGAAGLGAYVATRHDDRPTQLITGASEKTPAPTTSATPTPSAPTPVAQPTYPAAAFYPFTSEAAEQQWEAQGGPQQQPWVTDPRQQAKRFATDFLGTAALTTMPAVTLGKSTADVTLGRNVTDGTRSIPLKVTTVHLAKFGKAWVVVGASDPAGYLRLSTPASGQRLTSPARVSGPGFGVDEGVTIDVRTISGDAAATHPNVSFGNGTTTWTTSVTFAPADSRGAVVVSEASAADGGPGRIVVTGVTFPSSQVSAYPAVFYGVKNGRVTQFSTRSGAALRYLSPAEPGGGASDPQVVGDTVFYLRGSGTCANDLVSVPLSGGTPKHVASPDAGYVFSSYGVDANGVQSALVETSCLAGAGAAPQSRLVFNTLIDDTHTQSHAIDFPSSPPLVEGDPVWERDGQHVDAVVRTGTRAHVARYDALAAKTWDDSTTVCDAAELLPFALDIDNAGDIWVAAQKGDGKAVARCSGTTASVVFTVPRNDAPADVVVANNGGAILLTNGSGDLWRWTPAGGPVQLHPIQPQPQVSW